MRPRLPPSDADDTDIPPGYFLLPFFCVPVRHGRIWLHKYNDLII